MSTLFNTRPLAYILSALFFITVAPCVSTACGCGCNVFSVGNRWMMATHPGLKLSVQYNYMDQNRNWNGSSRFPADSNADKEVRTSFYTVGFHYMASRDWGVIAEVPVWNRYFSTTDDNGVSASAEHSSIGDARLLGVYSGFSEDMSTAVLFGMKLPTGAIDQSLFDRDTQIGTGSTDLLLGAYQMGQESSWGWYAHAQWQHAVLSKDNYRPGDSFDLNIGFHYDDLVRSTMVIPMLQVIGSFRGCDNGLQSHPEDTGYQRLFAAPGVEVQLSSSIQIFVDYRIPLITNVNGNQLVAPSLVNASANISL